MRLIPKPLVIGEADGYDKVVIDRSDFGNFLTSLVRNTPEPLVIAIDGRWGEGKTTFVKLWRNQLECTGETWKSEAAEKRVPTLYIDAFKMEATGEVFSPLIGEIKGFVDKQCDNRAYLNKFVKAAIRMGAKVTPEIAKGAIKSSWFSGVLLYLFGLNSTVFEWVTRNISTQAEKFIAKRIDSLMNFESERKEFEYHLKKLPSVIRSNPTGQLVIIVDELDRCSPIYVVDFLEKIKHFFSTDNIKFVLAVNKQQIVESIRSVYGSNAEAPEYLQKFIDIEARLPRNNYGSSPDPDKFCDRLMNSHNLEKQDALNQYFKKFVSLFARHGNLSLREIEHIFRTFVTFRFYFGDHYNQFISEFHDDGKPFVYPAIAYACIIKVIDHPQYRKLFTGKSSAQSISLYCNNKLIHLNDRQMQRDLEIVELWAAMSHEFDSRSNSKLKDCIDSIIGRSNLDREGVMPRICRAINGFQDI